MGIDAQHRPLVSLPPLEQAFAGRVHSWTTRLEEETMGRGILLWLLGVPIPVIILLWLFFGR